MTVFRSKVIIIDWTCSLGSVKVGIWRQIFIANIVGPLFQGNFSILKIQDHKEIFLKYYDQIMDWKSSVEPNPASDWLHEGTEQLIKNLRIETVWNHRNVKCCNHRPFHGETQSSFLNSKFPRQAIGRDRVFWLP